MKIAVCDDEEIIMKELKQIIIDIMEERRLQPIVDEYKSGNQLIKNAMEYEGVFLDMDMPDIDGIEVAREIRKINPECVIIMATGRGDRFREAFHINASDFITKPFQIEDVKVAIDIIEKSMFGTETVLAYKKASKYEIRQKNVELIEAYDGYVLIYSKGVEFRRESTIKDIKKEINNELFIEVRRGKIVNLYQIDKYEKGIICIKNREIKVARSTRKEFEKKYLEFDLRYRSF